LFKKTKRKNVTVEKAMAQNRWVSHISPIQPQEELHEFIGLWEYVNMIIRRDDA
jgi:hypothetical protein